LSQKIPFFQHTAIEVSTLAPQGLDAPEGVYGTANYLFYYPETPENKAFVQAFEKAYGNPPGFPAFNAYITAQLIAAAYKKAGKIDKEKFIDAIEGMKVKGPTGSMVEMRACDHQAVYPMYFGTTKKLPQYDFVVASDILTLSGNEVMPSCDDILKARKK
jgi:branched-chain amino acid transport system substrate-binding protein